MFKVGDKVIRRYEVQRRKMMAIKTIVRETKTLWITDDDGRYYKSDGEAYGSKQNIWSGEDRIVAYDEQMYQEWLEKWQRYKKINFCCFNIDLISTISSEELDTIYKILYQAKQGVGNVDSNTSGK